MTWTKASPLTLLIALGASLFFAASTARAEDGVLRVGIITDMSGQYSDGNGTGSVVAAQMAAEEIGGKVAGRRIEIISADHQNKPDVAAGIVRKWIDTKGVDVIAEGVNSAVALAIQTVTRERKKLFLISGSGSSELTGKQCSPTSVQWTYDTYASSNATAKAVVARGGTPWFFLTADYAFGQALERDASKAVTAAGGKVLGAIRHPFDTADFSSFLLQAQSSGAKILALANAGSDFRNAVAQGDEFNIRESMQVVALQVTLTDVPALGLQHAHDLLFTDSFYWDRTPETRAFSQEFFKRHGAMPTAYQAGVNSALRHYFKAVAATNSVDPETVIAQMRKTPVNDFFAQGGVVREDGRMVHDMYLMRIKKPEESKSKWDLYEYLATIPGDQAFRPLNEGGCPYITKAQ
ncbi:ABC transporter substrate-binding protein [Bradyrhizobium sp. ISRA443]|uniref:ABC transporter substrate-binding protein n=1 Tax=unclassified Bradyrhizobium TaxID=2631580 RepID=UPI0024794947|nr:MULTISPECIES: ABC transporter substrate-binding protein [unclassified Bradyrhizobium]WGR97105.1 ABC transporter substrate-binding protein [Bradyrhizobium sp. ISRA436]WGS03993.1 ABC transporter substrate-binding protein [Bradyrhizobium sp. ISRA437]WGS10876.1 ABC transporter substrate-binding protein [Bradyrhizobium sp. ISRA443]